jgi:hypothetical protein
MNVKRARATNFNDNNMNAAAVTLLLAPFGQVVFSSTVMAVNHNDCSLQMFLYLSSLVYYLTNSSNHDCDLVSAFRPSNH